MFNINSKYENDILQYCKINNIGDVNLFVTQCFKQGFDIKKYGFLGNSLNEGEKDLKTDNEGEKDLIDSRKTCGIEEKRVEIEVIREIRVEVPVEVIREVEKIVEIIKEIEVIKEVTVEVPVEKIVTKIEYISDKDSENELLLKIQQLEETIFHLNDDFESERQEFSTKTQELTKIFQDKISKENIKVVEVEKEVVVDNSKQKMLESTLQNLRKELTLKNSIIDELETKNKQLESQNNHTPAVYLKGSNLSEKM